MPPIPGDKLILLTQKGPDIETLFDGKRYLFVKVSGVFRWTTVNIEVDAERNSTTPRDPSTINTPAVQADIAKEFDNFKQQLSASVTALGKQIYGTLDQTQQRPERLGLPQHVDQLSQGVVNGQLLKND